MALTTKEALISRFGERDLIQLTDRNDPPEGCIDDVVLNKAIEDASELVLSYLRARYDVSELSESPAPPMDTYVQDIVLWLLTKKPTSWIQTRYDSAMDWLKRVSRGEVTLGLNSLGNAPSMPGSTIYHSPDDRTSDQRLKGSYF